MWAVVTFYDEAGAPIELVPQGWLREEMTKCFSPAIKKQRLFDEAVRMGLEPNDGWPQYPVRVQGNLTGW